MEGWKAGKKMESTTQEAVKENESTREDGKDQALMEELLSIDKGT